MDIAKAIVQFLTKQGVSHVYTVPGESFLPLLCAFDGGDIAVINARHESAASMMAECSARITGNLGVCMVTRGPGMANAMAGLHCANQSQTPLLFLIGQVANDERGKGVFQEVDFAKHLKSVTKAVVEVTEKTDIIRQLHRITQLAVNGTPGPVAMAIPEDLFTAPVNEKYIKPVKRKKITANDNEYKILSQTINNAKRPIIIAGGGLWNDDLSQKLVALAERGNIPVAVEFRRQGIFPNAHPLYAGDLTFATNPLLKRAILESDLVILLGARLSDPSNICLGAGQLLGQNGQKIVQIYYDKSEFGRIYPNAQFIYSDIDGFLDNIIIENANNQWGQMVRAGYESWVHTIKFDDKLALSQGFIANVLRTTLPRDSIMTNGAGNYAIWMQRYFPFTNNTSQLAPISGTMGYGLPAAITAGLQCKDRRIICLAGDGCIQMVLAELAVVMQHALPICIIIFDNGRYGTIAMHQMNKFPNQNVGIDIENPNFAMVGQAYNIDSYRVTTNEEFLNIWQGLNPHKPAIIHCIIDKGEVKPC